MKRVFVPAIALRHCSRRLVGRVSAMRTSLILPVLLVVTTSPAWSAVTRVGLEPIAAPAPPALPVPSDKPFTGTIELAVNASDTDHQVFSVHETIPIQASGDTVLLYPQWETASHAPTAGVAELAGLSVSVDGAPADWVRDPADMHAFHVQVQKGARSLTLDFQFLPPAAAGFLRPDLVVVPWQRVLLYPSGWYVRQIRVASTLVLPRGLTPFTSLTFHRAGDGTVGFQTVTLDQLVDAPVYAGRYTRQIQLDEGVARPVRLDLLADAEADLDITAEEIGRIKALVSQSLKTFGVAPYRHYDVIVTLSDVLSPGGGGGVEHLEEGENNLPAEYFTRAEEHLNDRDLIVHEFVHAWNGRWREPANLWSPTFNQPVGGSLLWVYEGQTEFWGRVLAARAGLRDRQQTLDKLAMDAATVANRDGRSWKNLQDSTNDAIYMAGHHVSWRDWQRREDYYPEGVMLWLDVDARLRELTQGRRGLDDFARAFFDARDSHPGTSTYDFEDVCNALNRVAADDWAAFLVGHLRSHRTDDAMAGLARAGWKLGYDDIPTATFRQEEKEAGVLNLDYSIGLQIDEGGKLRSVQWNGPAFRAGLSPGTRVIEVDGQPFTPDKLITAVRATREKSLDLSASIGGVKRRVVIDYRGGLRYPRLQRIEGTNDWLSALLGAH